MVGMECARKMPIGMAIFDLPQPREPNWLPTSIGSRESRRSAHLDECFVCDIFQALQLFSSQKVCSLSRNFANHRRRIRHVRASNGKVAKMCHCNSHCSMNRIQLDWLQHIPPKISNVNAKEKMLGQSSIRFIGAKSFSVT